MEIKNIGKAVGCGALVQMRRFSTRRTNILPERVFLFNGQNTCCFVDLNFIAF